MHRPFAFLLAISLSWLLTGCGVLGAKRVENRYPPVGQFVTVDDVRLHYDVAGDGPAIVLLHGASSNLNDFRSSLMPLLAREHRVYVFDRPGFGYSERPTGQWPDPDRQAQLIHDALVNLGETKAVVVGHSWSGSLALAWLLRYPDTPGGVLLAGASHSWDSGVALSYTLGDTPIIGPFLAYTTVYPLGIAVMDAAIASVFEPNAVTPGYQERIAAPLALRPVTYLSNSEDMANLSPFLEAQSAHYRNLKPPVLMIHGDRDELVPAWNHAERLKTQLPNARLVVLPGMGHVPHHVEPEKVAGLIADFVKRVSAG